MSKQIKRKAKKTKKNIVAIIPIYCTWCNACVIGLILLMGVSMLGGFDWLYTGENATDTDNDDADTTTTPPEYLPDVLYRMAVQINGWTEEPYGDPPGDMVFEIYKLSSYSGVGSGEWYGDLYLPYTGSPWIYSSESEHFTYGKAVAVDMFMSINSYELTTDVWLSTYVGAPEAEYEVYLNGYHAMNLLLKWVVV